jgi:hypothetical protein
MSHPAWWGALFVLALPGCSNGSATPSPGNDAGADSTVVDARGIEDGNPFAFDAPGCSNTLKPRMPCSMGNMICATPVQCEACPGGYVRRSAACTCGGGFWNCDECTTCATCEAGTVYQNPACTAGPRDAGAEG